MKSSFFFDDTKSGPNIKFYREDLSAEIVSLNKKSRRRETVREKWTFFPKFRIGPLGNFFSISRISQKFSSSKQRARKTLAIN